jgi:hypothetical protein
MSRKPDFKRVQVDGERFVLPGEEVEVEKLIKKGLGLEKKLQEIKEALGGVKGRLTEIAAARRQGTTTIRLRGIASGEAVVTFRESWVADSAVEELAPELKDLFPKFFAKKVDYAVTKELSQFLSSEHDLGMENAEDLKEKILTHVTRKEIKPNVKLSPT